MSIGSSSDAPGTSTSGSCTICSRHCIAAILNLKS